MNIKYFQKIRQQIHTYPELRYEEIQTAKLVANELNKMGLTVQTGIGNTGVVALLDSGKPGKTVALRADMDALPLTETTSLPYQSKIPGKMHACGHDGHTATLLAAAHALVQRKQQFNGKIKFIFQPAEEGGGAGARAMIAEGVLENPQVDAIFAFHNHPKHPLGALLTRKNCMLTSNSIFTCTIHGKSGHAAAPNLAIDPIMIGAAIVQQLPNLERQLSNATDPVIIAITQFFSGTANNIIPDVATLSGTIRAMSEEKKATIKSLLQTFVTQIAIANRGTAEIKFEDFYPPTINTDAETDFVMNVARTVLGETNVQIKPTPARASEDFAFYLQKIPGCYFFLGNGKDSASCHSAKYDFNDNLLPIAAELLCAIAINYLNNQPSFKTLSNEPRSKKKRARNRSLQISK